MDGALVVLIVAICTVFLSFALNGLLRIRKSQYILRVHPDVASRLSGLTHNAKAHLIPYSELQIQSLIGKGTQGEVFAALWRNTLVAVKKIDTRQVSQRTISEFISEADFLRQIHHPCIGLFMGICIEPPHLCIVSEFVHQGSLFAMLRDSCTHFSFKVILRMAVDIAEGVNYLHKFTPPILHRDLKSLNLLVDRRFRIKVVDFGLTRFQDEQGGTMTACGRN